MCLTHLFSSVFARKKAGVPMPHDSQNGERRRARAGSVVDETEIVSIMDKMVGGSIQEVKPMYELIEHALTLTRKDLPVFQPSQTATSAMPRQQMQRQKVPPARTVPVPRQYQNGEKRKAEIASIFDEMTRGRSSDPASVQEMKEMFEFIERALTFTRSDLPVFQPSKVAPAPRPALVPRYTGAVFTPGAVFEPQAARAIYEPRGAGSVSTHGAPLKQGGVLSAR